MRFDWAPCWISFGLRLRWCFSQRPRTKPPHSQASFFDWKLSSSTFNYKSWPLVSKWWPLCSIFYRFLSFQLL